MQATDELLTIAELAITLAGFAGVAVVFAERGRLLRVDRWRFAGILSLAVGAAVMAFVPSTLSLFDVSGQSIWRWSSGIFVVVGLVYVAAVGPRVGRIARDADATVPLLARGTVYMASLLNLIMQLANTVGWPASPQPGIYVVGLLIWITTTAFGFGFIVLVRPR